MSKAKRRRLESTVSALQRRYGEQALRKGEDLPPRTVPPGVATGFAQLDAITGCAGVPVGHITLLSGSLTSGKLTLAYKALANGQAKVARQVHSPSVAVIEFTRSSNPDYLDRCGVELADLLIIRPQPDRQAVSLLLDLVASRQLRVLLVDSLADLTADRGVARHLNATLDRLHHLVQHTHCALLFIDDPYPPWQRWFNLDSSWAVRQKAALHIELRRECWLMQSDVLVGYQAISRMTPSYVSWRGVIK
jgi:RecA/RadA recombinase